MPPTRLLFLAALLPGLSFAAPATGKLRFNRDIRPILSDNCFYCHGPDKNHREADLRLDIREEAITAKAIIPGKPEASSLVERILTHDKDDVMPPLESKKSLTEAQRKTLAQWIAEGAEYEPHWAYTPLIRPKVPATKSAGANPIDAFIQAALTEQNIASSPPADPRTLIRRTTLDLIGLPPTPAEVDQFVSDHHANPTASLQQLTERHLRNPHFGERWATWWLDVARFADTVGFHGDQNQRIFPYRDYVINAFNSNKRFDQFTLEQLAGDLLPKPTTEQLVASGFNRLNMMTREGGAQPKEYLAKYQADRVRTVGGAWMGATLGCCECHDHKFDPYKQRDFYAISAYFGDVKQWGVYSDYGYTKNDDLKGWTNEHPFPPEILVDSPYLKQRLQRIEKQMADTAVAALKATPASFAAWRQSTLALLEKSPSGWITPKPTATTVLAPPTKRGTAPKAKAAKPAAIDPSLVTVESDGRVLITAKAAQNTTLTFNDARSRVAAIKIELLPHAAHKDSIELNGTEAGMMIAPQFKLRKAGAKADVSLAVLYADADFKEPRYSGTVEQMGVKSGWKTLAKKARATQTAVWILNEPVSLGEGDALTISLTNHTAGCIRVSLAPVAPLQPLDKDWLGPLTQALKTSSLTDPRLAQTWLAQSGENKTARDAWAKLYTNALECNQGQAWTQVTAALKEPLTIRILKRGNWMDESGEIVPPTPPEFLAGPASSTAPRQTRADLARWLTSKENPLTPRAFVNRLWKQFFGIGLSTATDDLGAQGETPSHPELLDWLACEFRDSGWDIQQIMKLIVTSAAYQQDSKARPELKEIDPNNRLLSYQNPRRLDAEFVRDNALFAAGLLNLEIGGPSVKPYQPPNYYENLQFPSRDYIPDVDDRQWRRGVYMHWQRTFLHPMLANFDAPSRDESACTRTVSNTPQQALTLLNDPTFVEAARVFAESLPATASDESRLNTIYLRALARLPKDREKQSLLGFLSTQRATFKANPADAQKLLSTGLRPAATAGDSAELAAWTSVCRVALNLHETITRY